MARVCLSFSSSSWMLIDLDRLGDVINHWRRTSLDLEPLSTMVGANMANLIKVPFTYCWSPSLIPKPFDWPSHIGQCLSIALLFVINGI
jgi:hypothetical protein